MKQRSETGVWVVHHGKVFHVELPKPPKPSTWKPRAVEAWRLIKGVTELLLMYVPYPFVNDYVLPPKDWAMCLPCNGRGWIYSENQPVIGHAMERCARCRGKGRDINKLNPK